MGFRRERPVERSVNTEADVQRALFRHGEGKKWPVMIPNTTVVFAWEADFIGVTRSDYVHEFEVKVDRSDLRSDLRAINKTGKAPSTKQYKYDVLMGRGASEVRRGYANPNYFWFAVTSDLVSLAEEELPPQFGIMAARLGLRSEVIREPKRLFNGKLDGNAYARIATCLSARFWRAA